MELMHISSFVLGMLSIVAMAFATAVIIGLLKINKLSRNLNSLRKTHQLDFDALYRSMESNNESIWRQFESCGKDTTMVEETIFNHIDLIKTNLEQDVDQVQRYVDSRIDKILNDPKFCLNKDMKNKKQTING